MSLAKTKITINEITAPVLITNSNMIGDGMQINSKLAANPFSIKHKSFSFLVPKSNMANLKRPVTSFTSNSLATSTSSSNNASDIINSLIFNRNSSTNQTSSNGNWLKTKTSLSSNFLFFIISNEIHFCSQREIISLLFKFVFILILFIRLKRSQMSIERRSEIS